MKSFLKESLYIVPSLELIDEIKRNKDTSPFSSIGKSQNMVDDFKELYKHNFLVVLAEPGNGKSRLLKEIVLQSNKYEKKAIYINLKSIGSDSIIKKIASYIKRPIKHPKTEKDIKEIIDYFFIEKFKLEEDSNNVLICLDALDEVSKDSLLDYVDKIENFRADFPSVQIVLSCRDYIYEHYESFLKSQQPQLLEIKPFTSYKVSEYLKGYGFTENDVENVLNSFYSSFKLEIINSPRVLEIFVSLKGRFGLESVLNKNKAELLDYFIYGRLDEEENQKRKTNKTDVIKRVLEKLALCMSIYQATEITKDELLTFFDDVKSSLNSTFLNQVDINHFLERSLLVHSSNGDKIQFENAEFQEFLAAKELTRFGRVDQALFDVVVDKTLNEIYPFWSNSIKYVLDLEPSVQLPLIEFICRKESAFNHELLKMILVSDTQNIARLNQSVIEKTFTTIYDLYQKLKWYIPNGLAEKLTTYYVESHEQKLLSDLNNVDKESIVKENVLIVLNSLLSAEKIVIRTVWTDRIVEVLRDEKSLNLIKGSSVRVLAYLNSLDLIKDTIDYYKIEDSSLAHEILRAVIKIDPNDPYTIDMIVDSVKKERTHSYSSTGFQHITSAEGILYFLNVFSKDERLVSRYNMYSPDKYTKDEIIANIRNVYNDKIQDVLNTIILNSSTNVEYDGFINSLLELVKSVDKDYIFKVVDFLKGKDLYRREWHRFNQIFRVLVSSENISTFSKEILEVDGGKEFIAFLMLIEFENSQDPHKREMFEKSKEFLTDQYEKQKDLWANNTMKRPSRKNSVYSRFQYMLLPEPDKFMSAVFDFYRSNRNILSKQITDKDKRRMKELLMDTVLKWDFYSSNFHIKYTNEEKTKYSVSDAIRIFGDAFDLFSEFEIPFEVYRQKLIDFIPYSFRNDNEEGLFKLIGDLDESEMDRLVNFYLKPRTDDLLTINVDNLFNVIRHYKPVQFVPFLEKIVFNTEYELYYRQRSLELLHILRPSFKLYKDVFLLFSTPQNAIEGEIQEVANAFLISLKNEYQEEAIIWRWNKILENVKEHKVRGDSKSVDSYGMGHKVGHFNQPLLSVNNREFQPIYLEFLEKAIELYDENNLNKSYAVYMWDTVIQYFDNLKVSGSYEPIQTLEMVILKHRKSKGFNLLFNSLTGTRLNYADILGKPISFSECISQYNLIKEKSYERISSSEDLYIMVQDIIHVDLRNWVEKEGAYKIWEEKAASEALIQKTLKTQIENSLLKRGIREKEIRIVREEQLLNDKRTDFVISYGFIGQVVIEIKLTKNTADVNDELYPEKLIGYIDGTRSDFGIFLFFQTSLKHPWSEVEAKIVPLYEKHANKIKIIGLDCTRSAS